MSDLRHKNKKQKQANHTMVISSKPITAPADNSGMIDWNNFVTVITNKQPAAA